VIIYREGLPNQRRRADLQRMRSSNDQASALSLCRTVSFPFGSISIHGQDDFRDIITDLPLTTSANNETIGSIEIRSGNPAVVLRDHHLAVRVPPRLDRSLLVVSLVQQIIRFGALLARAQGWALAHASAVSNSHGDAWLIGDAPQALGKSSLSTELALMGKQYIADEYVLINLASMAVWSPGPIPIHFRPDYCRHLQSSHGQTVQFHPVDGAFVPPATLFDDLVQSARLRGMLIQFRGRLRMPEQVLGSELALAMGVTLSAHHAKFLQSSLDSVSLFHPPRPPVPSSAEMVTVAGREEIETQVEAISGAIEVWQVSAPSAHASAAAISRLLD
jgi:hypothetical protein